MNFNVVGVNTYIVGSDDCLDFLDGLFSRLIIMIVKLQMCYIPEASSGRPHIWKVRIEMDQIEHL